MDVLKKGAQGSFQPSFPRAFVSPSRNGVYGTLGLAGLSHGVDVIEPSTIA
jgi:hypothetical protein